MCVCALVCSVHNGLFESAVCVCMCFKRESVFRSVFPSSHQTSVTLRGDKMNWLLCISRVMTIDFAGCCKMLNTYQNDIDVELQIRVQCVQRFHFLYSKAISQERTTSCCLIGKS